MTYDEWYEKNAGAEAETSDPQLDREWGEIVWKAAQEAMGDEEVVADNDGRLVEK